MGFKRQIFLIFACIAALVFLPTTFLLIIGMTPTFVAGIVDRSRKKIKVVTVGAMNLAGCAPFLFDLWKKGHSFDMAFSIVTDPTAVVVIYSAAAIGYMLDWALSGLVVTLMYQRGLMRKKSIEDRQQELVGRWGQEVTGDIPLDAMGYPIAPKTTRKEA